MGNVNLNLGNGSVLSLSESRMEKLMQGDIAGATKMGPLDSVKNLFSNKREKLEQMARLFEETRGLPRFEVFQQITRHLDDPRDAGRFTISKQGTADHPEVEFRINGKPVARDQISEPWWETIAARAGLTNPPGAQFHDREHAADWLAGHLENRDDQIALLRNEDFGTGGVHKAFHPGTGVLLARDEVGATDFQREARVQQLTEDDPALARYVSTQRAFTPGPDSLLDGNHSYARVDRYDDTVRSGEVDTQLTTLSKDETRSVTLQLVDMARVMYKANVSHRDMHMHNLMVFRPTGDDGAITLKAIDFGQSKVGEDCTPRARQDDVRYLFLREARSGALGDLETFQRNTMRSPTSNAQLKHYPLHKLMAQYESQATRLANNNQDAPPPTLTELSGNSVAHIPVLESIGKALLERLEHAGDDEARIDAAFDQAMLETAKALDAIDRAHLPPLPNLNQLA